MVLMLILSLTLMSMFILMYCIYRTYHFANCYSMEILFLNLNTLKDLIASCCMIGEQLQTHYLYFSNEDTVQMFIFNHMT